MTAGSTFRHVLRRAGPPALALIVMAFFGAYAIIGPNGIIAYGDYKREQAAQARVYAALDKHRAALRNRVKLLDRHRTNPDLAEELILRELKVANPNDRIIPLPPEK